MLCGLNFICIFEKQAIRKNVCGKDIKFQVTKAKLKILKKPQETKLFKQREKQV